MHLLPLSNNSCHKSMRISPASVSFISADNCNSYLYYSKSCKPAQKNATKLQEKYSARDALPLPSWLSFKNNNNRNALPPDMHKYWFASAELSWARLGKILMCVLRMEWKAASAAQNCFYLSTKSLFALCLFFLSPSPSHSLSLSLSFCLSLCSFTCSYFLLWIFH